jgi:hypothetical protein
MRWLILVLPCKGKNPFQYLVASSLELDLNN